MPSGPEPQTSTATRALVAGRQRALVRLRAAWLLSLFVPLVGIVVAAVWLHDREFADAGKLLDRSARIAEEHALKLFDTNEMLLQRMLDLLDDADDAALLRDAERLHQRLVLMAGTLPQVQGLFVNGADARMLASNRVFPPNRDIDYSDRDWYVAHREGDSGVFVTRQLRSRSTGERAFDMSRRRSRDGAFTGTVHVSLRPEYLTNFYEQLAAADPGLRMALVRRDGGIVARWPEPAPIETSAPASDPTMQQIAAGLHTGSATGESPFDRVVRLRTFRRLGDYPLYVVASMDRSAVLAAWQRKAGVVVLVLLPMALVLALLARQSIHRTRAELEHVQRLDEEIGRRQRAELALLQSQKLEAMGRLTGGVAHDFNNLLAIISSNVEVLKRLRPELATANQLRAIARAVDSGTRLTRQLLAFARKQALLPERILLQERLPAQQELLRPLLRSSIDVTIDVAPDTAPVEVDPAEFELAVINICVNASDAMGGSGKLAITARNATAGEAPAGSARGFVVIDVDDSGPGIPPDLADRIFEPFFTTKAIGAGTGLGLSQVRAFCQSTGGDAYALAAPGGGARMRLLLARCDAWPQVPVGSTATVAAIDYRVLVVEDNPEVANATVQLLESLGAKVALVATVEEAIDFVEARRAWVDVVLSDIEMRGGMDGIALALRLRQASQPVPAVLMTGYAQRLDEAIRQQLDVLPKPCAPGSLADALRHAVERGDIGGAPSTGARR